MFNLGILKTEAEATWARDSKLRAALRDDKAAWMQRVGKLEYAGRSGSNEADMVRITRDGFVNAGVVPSGGILPAHLPAHLLARIVASPTAASAVTAALAQAGVGYETEEQLHARAVAAFQANTEAGAKLRGDFAGNLGTYLAYDKAVRAGRVRVHGGGVKSFEGAAHA